jgi:RNA polymerase sigma-70 factor (ECF subfamily)
MNWPKKKRFMEAMEGAVAKLPKDLREVLVMVSMDGLSHEEVVDILGVPMGTVKSRLFRARQTVRETMTKAKWFPDNGNGATKPKKKG